MTLRIFACLECDHCHKHYDDLVSVRQIDELSEEIHRLVINAEDAEWESRKNATIHVCASCIESFKYPF